MAWEFINGLVWVLFYINGFLLFQGKETEPNQNQTGPIATYVYLHVYDQNNMPIASCQMAPTNQG